MANAKQLAPTQASNRIALLDIFRGFALFGIFAVNIRYMSASVNYYENFGWMTGGKLNTFTAWFLDMFFDGKFFPIFSFLFGVGFGMQINKMEEKGAFSNLFFIRRYLYLMLFGVLHLFFIWGGDVLILYSLGGFIVLALRKVPVKYVLLIALVILLFPYYGHILNRLDNHFVGQGYKSFQALKDYSYHDIVALKHQGSFLDNIKFRLEEYTVYYRNVEYFPSLIFIILCGYSAGRYKFYRRIPETLKKLAVPAIILFLVVLTYRLVFPHIAHVMKYSFNWYILFAKLNIIINITQAFLYLYIIAFLHENGIFVKLLEPLSFAGRMSLTNYIMQSLLGFILFNGMFFSLYGKLGFAWLAVISLAGYLLLLLFSMLWMKRFRFGPLEYLWRELSYNTILKFKKNDNSNQE